MGQHWIEREFSRTGLPKSALAGYLGLDNAAVSRTIAGERAMSADESDFARAFFSIVPEDASEDQIDAIRRLRSTKVREMAALALSELLLEKVKSRHGPALNELPPEKAEDPWGSLMALLQRVASRSATLTADQIVAICRLLEIEIGALIAGKARIRYPDEFVRRGVILAELQSAARRWVKGREPAYQFDRKTEPTAPRTSTSKANFITLQQAETTDNDLTSCTAYLIPDDSYAPRFEQGQTIFLASDSEPRKGDYVAALMKDSTSSDVRAVLGRLLYVSRDLIGISSARSIRMELPRSDIKNLWRIAYCKM
jgi:hypothetical protein